MTLPAWARRARQRQAAEPLCGAPAEQVDPTLRLRLLTLRPPLDPEPLDDPLRFVRTDLDKIIGRLGPLPFDDERRELPDHVPVKRLVPESARSRPPPSREPCGIVRCRPTVA